MSVGPPLPVPPPVDPRIYGASVVREGLGWITVDAPLAEPGEAERALLKRVLNEEGLDINGANPHSWRCAYPDRYPGACSCVDNMIEAILAAGFRAPARFAAPANPANVDAADLGLPTGEP